MSDRAKTVSDIGEQALVERVLSLLGDRGEGVLRGPGDDGAVVDPGGRHLVLSTDSQHEGVHFRHQWTVPLDLGRRALAVNVSDLGAMGAEPLWGLVAFALPPSTPLEWVENVARGLQSASEEFGCAIVGGDVTRVPERIGITVTVVGGLAPGRAAVLRSGAQPGDLCWVTGFPGRAAAGRSLLSAGYRSLPAKAGESGSRVELHGNAVSDAGPAEDAQRCLSAYLQPAPPVPLGVRVAGATLAHAMIDLSDGLAIDLTRICQASDVGVEIDIESLAVRAELQRWQSEGLGVVRDWVLGGGDDYQLLGASPPEAEEELLAVAGELGVALHVIGEFLPVGQGCRVRGGDGMEPLVVRGWDHFGPSEAGR